MTQNTSSGRKQPSQTSDMTRSAQGGSGATRDLTDQAKATAGQVADQAKATAGQVADTARQQVGTRLTSQKDRAAESLGGVAQALRQTSQQLREHDQAGVTSYVDQAANQIERFSGYLQNRDMGQLVDDVESFARRQPAAFLGGAFLIGLLGARFLKSSRPRPQYAGQYSSQYAGQYSGQTYGQYRQRYYTGYPSEQDIREASAVPNYGPGTKSGPYSSTSGASAGQSSGGAGARSYDTTREE